MVVHRNPLKTRNPLTGTLANSEDPDEMPQDAAFRLGLHYLLRQNRYSEKELHLIYFLKIETRVPSLCIIDHSSFMEKIIRLKMVCMDNVEYITDLYIKYSDEHFIA